MFCERCGNTVDESETVHVLDSKHNKKLGEGDTVLCEPCNYLWGKIYKERFKKSGESSANDFREWDKLFKSFMKCGKVKVTYT